MSTLKVFVGLEMNKDLHEKVIGLVDSTLGIRRYFYPHDANFIIAFDSDWELFGSKPGIVVGNKSRLESNLSRKSLVAVLCWEDYMVRKRDFFVFDQKYFIPKPDHQIELVVNPQMTQVKRSRVLKTTLRLYLMEWAPLLMPIV